MKGFNLDILVRTEKAAVAFLISNGAVVNKDSRIMYYQGDHPGRDWIKKESLKKHWEYLTTEHGWTYIRHFKHLSFHNNLNQTK